jgi:hypothetical protein
MAHYVTCDRASCPSRASMDDGADLTGWIAQHPMDPEAEDNFKHYCCKDCAVMDMLSSEIPDGVPHD